MNVYFLAISTFNFFPLIVIFLRESRTSFPFPFKISTYEPASCISIIPISSAVTPIILEIVPTKSTALIFFFLPPLK
jgi:hypothetical protein